MTRFVILSGFKIFLDFGQANSMNPKSEVEEMCEKIFHDRVASGYYNK